MGPPEALVLALQLRGGVEHFVETGTFRGDTASWAAGHFDQVITIELSPAFHAAALVRFHDQPKIRVLSGDSAAMLSVVATELKRPAIFWLDAHWSGSDTAGRSAECPVLAEIAAIDATRLAHFILVDDARLFAAPPPRPHCAAQWPDLATIVAALHGGGRRYIVLFDDVLVAIPSSDRQYLTTWLQDHPVLSARRGRLARWWHSIWK